MTTQDPSHPQLINVLFDLMAYWLKKEDALNSAEMHFYQAFTRLMKIQPLWEPYDQESKEFVAFAQDMIKTTGFKP